MVCPFVILSDGQVVIEPKGFYNLLPLLIGSLWVFSYPKATYLFMYCLLFSLFSFKGPPVFVTFGSVNNFLTPER
jgi:hypothetical protein